MHFYYLLFTILSCGISTNALSSTELSGTIAVSSENWPEYVEHTSVSAKDWNYSVHDNASLSPGSSIQEFGNSSFTIKPAFEHSNLSLSFTSFSDLFPKLKDCNFYLLADQREISFSENNIHSGGFFNVLLTLPIPETQVLEIGVLADSTCDLILSSISITERAVNIDVDDDGIEDTNDNCPGVSNPDQLDTNFDNIGDLCTFDRTKYVGSSLPSLCFNSSDTDSNIEPDNDNDGIIDVCDPDDDNDGISDLDEVHWGMDIFTAFDFEAGKVEDPDNDGLFSADEIEIGLSPNNPNTPPAIKLGKYFLNHEDSQKAFTPFEGSIFKYQSEDNYSFTFGHNAVLNHFELENELLLTGTTIKHDNTVFSHTEFEPAIRIFPSPTLIDHNYVKSNPITVKVINNETNEVKIIPATLQISSKIHLSDGQQLLTYQYSYKIYDENSLETLIFSSSELMTWSENKGFMGLGFSENLRSVNTYIPVEKITDAGSNNNSSGGSFSFLWGVILLVLILIKLTRPSRIMAMLR